MIEPLNIIEHFYPEDTPLRRLLLKHSSQVRDKAFAILKEAQNLSLNLDLVRNGAMLHDIGIIKCHAPKILCMGDRPYISHGICGAEMLRAYGAQNGLDLEAYARICERHTGSGITAQEVIASKMPIPARDYLPETLEEKLVCLADKFFSKSGDMLEESPEQVRAELSRFGEGSLARFNARMKLFNVEA